MRDLDLILSISKKISLACFLMSCSSLRPIIPNDLDVKNKKEEKRADSKTRVFQENKKKVLFGPQAHGNGDFLDLTSEYGLDGVEGVHFYAIDFSLDGYTDLVILSDFYATPDFYKYHPRLKKFIKEDRPFFETTPFASFLNFADFNKDGILDLVVAVLNQKSELTQRPIRIYRGVKKREGIFFEKVEKSFKKEEIFPSTSIAVLDYNLDGELDLLVGNWFDHRSKKFIPNRLYKGRGLEFFDVSNLLEGEHKYNRAEKKYPHARPTQGVSVCDIDKNGFPDLLFSNGIGYANQMFIQKRDRKSGNFHFIDIGEQVGFSEDLEGKVLIKGGGNSFFSKCLDYNNDGIIDIISGELFHSHSSPESDRSAILTGRKLTYPPAFIRSEYIRDGEAVSWSQADRRVTVLDYNNDGLQDFIVDNSGFPPSTRLVFFKQAEDHAYDDVAGDLGIDILNPAGTIFLDVNKDGKMDFLTGQTSLRARKGAGKKRIYFFKNNSKSKGRSYRIHLRGWSANRDGIGATLKIKTKYNKYLRYVETNSGWLPSQNEGGVHFAVPEGDELETMTVLWPILKDSRVKEVVYTKLEEGKQNFLLHETGRIE